MARRGVGHADAELHDNDCYARMQRRAEPLRARRFADDTATADDALTD